MSAKGSFSVHLKPQEDEGFAAGRMRIDKTYTGDLNGTGTGQMISKRTDGGAAVYYAIEEVAGSLAGKRGAFTLVHKGYMDEKGQSLEVTILEGSGTDQLQGITGSMVISQDDSGHQYQLSYQL